MHTLEFEGELSDYVDQMQLENLTEGYTVFGESKSTGYIYPVKNEKTLEMIRLIEEHCQGHQIAFDTLNLRAESSLGSYRFISNLIATSGKGYPVFFGDNKTLYRASAYMKKRLQDEEARITRQKLEEEKRKQEEEHLSIENKLVALKKEVKLLEDKYTFSGILSLTTTSNYQPGNLVFKRLEKTRVACISNAGTREIEITVPGELQMQALWVQERSKKLNVFITSSQDTLNHIYNGCYDALINAFGTDYLSLFYPKIVDPQNNAEFMHIIYKGVPSLTALNVLNNTYVPNTQDVLKNQKNHQTRFFGDMHANAHKMITMLESDGVLTFSDKDQDKKTVQQLYYSNDINVTAFHDFIYSGNIKAISQLSPLVFIGDLLADRGKNDLLILFILDFLNKNKINFSIVYSNHDAEFVKNIYNIHHQKYDNIRDQLGSGQAQSLHGLKQSLQKGLYTNDHTT